MKILYILLTICLLAGTSAQRKEFIKPTEPPLIFHSKLIDSLSNSSKKDDKEADQKTDLLIKEKKKIERENILLKKEIVRLNILVSNKPDTVFLKQESFFKRLFKKKKKKTIELKNDY